MKPYTVWQSSILLSFSKYAFSKSLRYKMSAISQCLKNCHDKSCNKMQSVYTKIKSFWLVTKKTAICLVNSQVIWAIPDQWLSSFLCSELLEVRLPLLLRYLFFFVISMFTFFTHFWRIFDAIFHVFYFSFAKSID